MRNPYRPRARNTFADLITKFYTSGRYRAWSESTRYVNGRFLTDLMKASGQLMVADMSRGDVIGARDAEGDTPGAANNRLKLLRVLLDYAVDLEMVTVNVARTVPRLKMPNPDGFRVWREDEIAAYRAFWPLGMLARTAFEIALNTGAAAGDLVFLGWHSVEDGRIRYKRAKTGRLVDIPLLPDLAAALVHIPRTQLTFLQTEDGNRRSKYSMTGDMAGWVEKAGLGDAGEHGRHLSFHGLRKALGRRLAEAGCSPHEVMAVLGHEAVKSAEVYTKAYDRARAADAGMGKLSPPETNVTRLKKPSSIKGGGRPGGITDES